MRRTQRPPRRSMAGIDDHAAPSVPHEARRAARSPTRWLFSGWKTPAKTLSRADARRRTRGRRTSWWRSRRVGRHGVVASARSRRTSPSATLGERGHAPHDAELVPAHVRHLALRVAREADDAAAEDAEPAHAGRLLALVEEELHAEADAEERPPRARPRARTGSTRPARASGSCMHVPKAPCPGSTTAGAVGDARRRRW